MNLTDINDIIALCRTHPRIHDQCKTKAFWKPIFEQRGFPLPQITPTSLSDWVDQFNAQMDVKEVMYILYLGETVELSPNTIIYTTDILMIMLNLKPRYEERLQRKEVLDSITINPLDFPNYNITVIANSSDFNIFLANTEQVRLFLNALFTMYDFSYSVIQFD